MNIVIKATGETGTRLEVNLRLLITLLHTFSKNAIDVRLNGRVL